MAFRSLRSERGHGSARWTGPQAGGDCDVDEGGDRGRCESAAQSSVAGDPRDEVVPAGAGRQRAHPPDDDLSTVSVRVATRSR